MKGDFSRSTFNKEKHYRSVLMQQGRVQTDADWNEEVDIQTHRIETETRDTIGPCGTPLHQPGFHLVTSKSDLTEDEKKMPENKVMTPLKKGDFYISAGHYYVDGILCRNEKPVPFSMQPDLDKGAEVVSYLAGDELKSKPWFSKPTVGIYLAYLDVWQRHITALEDDYIREKALGGPDTTTRSKTVWQVKLIYVDTANKTERNNCSKPYAQWEMLLQPEDGKLAARAEEDEKQEKPCILSPSGGYRRLENQLYRVEIHRGGKLSNAKKDSITFKWSRDNGSVVTKWEKQDATDTNKLTVSSTGPDEVLNFAAGHWVELTDDNRELESRPGVLVQLKKVEGLVLTIDPDTIKDPDNPAATSVDRTKFKKNPKIRRWDIDSNKISSSGCEMIVNNPDEWIELEDGVQVKFSAGSYKTGDYWLIPARTADADVEWPFEVISNKKVPHFQPPHGIKHHYCKLAILKYENNQWQVMSDCRRLFPPVTELTCLHYVGGDGQEAMPNKTLEYKLRVRVANGRIPVIGVKVRFTVKSDGAQVLVKEVNTSSSDGIAEYSWTLGAKGKQQVIAELLDAAGDPVPGQVVIFTANLSLASQVAYEPGCEKLHTETTVQEAIDKLCSLIPKPGGGCSVTIGTNGQFPTLHEAFAAMKEWASVSFCLLPGIHPVEQPLEIGNMYSIKISGCGAASVIKQSCEKFYLSADHILLLDFALQVENPKGHIILTGNEVTAERCTFERHVGSAGIAPLVLVQPRTSPAVIHWKSNFMAADWKEYFGGGFWELIEPDESVKISNDTVEKLKKLIQTNIYKNDTEYKAALVEMAQIVAGISGAKRKEWVKKRKTDKINKLVPKQKEAVQLIYNVVNTPAVNTEMMVETLDTALYAFIIVRHSDAMALSEGMGGWIKDNEINSYLSLNYEIEKDKKLSWNITFGQKQDNKKRFVSGSTGYLTVVPVSLAMHGNRFYAVRSNAYPVMFPINGGVSVIDHIINTGKWPADTPQVMPAGYELITVTGNVFRASNNSFVCKSMIMKGNRFNGATAYSTIAAFVYGEDGIFMGNSAPFINNEPTSWIEVLLKNTIPQIGGTAATGYLNFLPLA